MSFTPDFRLRCFRVTFVLIFFLVVLKFVVFTVNDVLKSKLLFKPNFTDDLFRQGNTSVSTFTVNLDTENTLFATSKYFLSFSLDLGEIQRDYGNVLGSLKVRRLVSQLSGGYIRLGGKAVDILVFAPTRPLNLTIIPFVTLDGGECAYENVSCPKPELNDFTTNPLVLTAYKWLFFNSFVNSTGFKLLFNFNVLQRKADGSFDTSNAEELLDVSLSYQLNIDWQLGNEPNALGRKQTATLSPAALASDFKSLHKLLQTYPTYKKSLLVGPDVLRPKHPSRESDSYLKEFLSAGAPVDAITWHHYYTGPKATADDFLNPSLFDSFRRDCQFIKTSVKQSNSPTRPIWIGETGSAYGAGAPRLSNAFITSLLWLDKLGIAAQEGVSVVIRQSLIRGHYGLIDDRTFDPNPDYWVSLLYKKLVGHRVLSVNTNNEDGTLRVYAHCSTKIFQPVFFGVNLANYTQNLKLKYNTSSEVYMLAGFPDLLSRQVSLNGVPLSVSDDGDPPELEPVLLHYASLLPVLPRSIFFLQVNVNLNVCDLN